ncbi:DUF6624 domain-containing protein [Stenotrophomonas sp. TWI169]|uniref:DUF6624 domain-containing protein n=1 Tax=Stenotrophomonas TaxID=40323 RepID=UPI0018D35625|nr:DUF6624 domain-containing protein [Stenotrophomonas maltophilia]MBH1665483.1 hypothetical protein [Stenotrophomonas maltophilia]
MIAILFAPLGASGGTPADPELRGELLRMKDADQAVRDLPLTTEGEERVLSAVDAVHTARLKAIVAAHGWPTVAQVGQDGADAAWLLAQHADKDPAFQRSVAEAMEPLVATGQVKASNYAYLWDRTHDPQRYGTQGRCADPGRWEPRAVEAPETLDERRARMGLAPMAEYQAMVSRHCEQFGR